MNLAASEHQDDQLLNATISRANIKESFECYLEIVDAFYSDDVEVILGEGSRPFRPWAPEPLREYGYSASIS